MIARNTALATAVALAGMTLSVAATANQPVLEEIIVTAQKRAESLQDVPISVATLSEDDFNAFAAGGEDILGLANRVPGLYAESSNGRAAPRFYLRGLGNIDFDLAASQPVSVVMDEVVMENVVLKSFPIFDVAQIEVIRGPQGTLFGRNTTAGIIKIDSVKPSFEPDGHVSASLGTFETKRIEAAWGGGIVDDVLAVRVSGLWIDREDWIDNGFTGEGDAMGGFDDKALRLQALWQVNDDIEVLGTYRMRELDGTASMFRANVFTPGDNSLNRNFDRDTVWYDDDSRNPQGYDQDGFSLKVDWALDGMTLTSITAIEEADGFSRGDIDGGVVDFSGVAFQPPGIDIDPAAPVFGNPTLTFPGTINVPSVTQDSADVEQFTQEFRLASDTDGPFSWQTGFFYFDSTLEVTTDSFASFGFITPGQQDTIVEHENETWAVYGQGSYDVSEVLTLTAGLRYTEDEKQYEVKQFGGLYVDLGIPPVAPIDVDDSNVSWELAFNRTLSENSNLYGRVASGFRAQSIQGRDVAFLESPTTADSETILSWEIGYKADLLQDTLRVNTAFWRYTVDDIQLSVIGGATNSNQVINADEASAWGVEADVMWLAAENLVLTVGWGWNHTEIDDDTLASAPCGSGLCTVKDPLNANGQALLDGNPLPRVPDWTLNATARWDTQLGNGAEVYVFTDWVVQGETNMPLYEAVEFETDRQFEGGARLGYLSPDRTWEVALFGRNITDEENVKGFVDFSNNTGFVNEPRVWGLEARVNFGG